MEARWLTTSASSASPPIPILDGVQARTAHGGEYLTFWYIGQIAEDAVEANGEKGGCTCSGHEERVYRTKGGKRAVVRP